MAEISIGADIPYTLDATATRGTVMVASATNAGNAKIAAASGALGIVGVLVQDAIGNSTGGFQGDIRAGGVAMCKFLTGTTITAGDMVKVGDANGRCTKLTAGATTLVGLVGIARQTVNTAIANDTLFEVQLQIGTAMI